MKDIKQFFLSIILFIPFAMLIYITFLIIGYYFPAIYPKPNNVYYGFNPKMYLRMEDIKNYNDVDVLFLGSSHSYRSFDTRIYEDNNLRCFNLGSSSQTPIQTEVLLQRYLKHFNPKTIVFEVSPMIFSLDGIESSLDFIANYRKHNLCITKLVKWYNIKTINALIVRQYKEFINVNRDFHVDSKIGKDLYISGGFVEREISFYKPNRLKNKRIKINKDQLKAFNRIVKEIHSKNIKLILVQAPITNSLYSSYSNMTDFDKLMTNYQTDYYNFNKLLNLNDSIYFYDSHHLNQNGVTVFNKEFVKLLDL